MTILDTLKAPMKITYFLKDVTAHGGMERVLANKCNYLAAAGYEVHIVSICSTRGRQPFFQFHPGIRMWSLDCDALYRKGFMNKLRQRRNRIRFIRVASGILQKIGSDIVISMYDEYSRHLHRINDGSAKVLELHFAKHKSAQYLYTLEKLPAFRGLLRFYKRRDYALIEHYDRFVVLTEEDKQAWGNLPNMTVIPNAQTFPCGRRSTLERKRVIALGRNTSQKRFDLLIRAWAEIAEHYPDGELTIIGPGNKDELHGLAEQLGVSGSVVLQDSISDVAGVLLDSAVLALSSRYEGFGMVLIEAKVGS